MKSHWIIFVTGLLVVVCLMGCDDSKPTVCVTADCADTVVIVLCDLTASVDSTVSLNVRKAATQVFDRYGDRTRFAFAALNDADYNQVLQEYHKYLPVEHRYSEELDAKENQVAFNRAIDSMLRFDSARYRYQRTCISLGLNSAYEYIEKYVRSDNRRVVRLYILSDFVEDCDADPRFGRLSLVHEQGVKKAESRLAGPLHVDSLHNLQKLGVEILGVFESTNLKSVGRGEQTGATRGQLESVWRAIFQRFGYSARSDSIGFSLLTVPDVYR
jgi:hypothetical protein